MQLHNAVKFQKKMGTLKERRKKTPGLHEQADFGPKVKKIHSSLFLVAETFFLVLNI